MTRILKNTTVFGMLMAVSSLANAVFLTSNTITSPVVVDFSDQATVEDAPGPIQVGGLVGADLTVVITPASNDIYMNFDGWGLGDNGDWDAPMTYVSSNLDGGPGLRFAFNDGPVSEVGAFMNYYPDDGAPLVIVARDAGNAILESYDVSALADISTPSGSNAGAFRGISRPTADIAYFEVVRENPTVDELTYSSAAAPLSPTNAIPTMSVYGLMLSALGLVLLASRRLSTRVRKR